MSMLDFFVFLRLFTNSELEHCKNDFGKDFENYLKSLHCSDDFDFSNH